MAGAKWVVDVKRSGSQIRRYGPCRIEVAVTMERGWAKPITEITKGGVRKARLLAQAATQPWKLKEDKPQWWEWYEKEHYTVGNTVTFVAEQRYLD